MKVIVITGASGGLGCALAGCFGRSGDSVVVHYHSNRKSAEAAARLVTSGGGKVLLFQADLRNRSGAGELTRSVMRQWGRIDGWINNAAIAPDAMTERIDEKQWDEVMAVNLSGTFYAIQEAGRVMMRQKSGHIINIASLVGYRGNIGQGAYAASKAGVIALTKTAASELGRFNVQVNAVLPGFLPTPMTRNLRQKYVDQITRENVLGRSTEVAEVSQFIHDLCGLRHVSGQVFNLDSRIL